MSPSTARLVEEPANPFDPAHFASLRKPYTEADTLPAWCYTSEAVWRREKERIFRDQVRQGFLIRHQV